MTVELPRVSIIVVPLRLGGIPMGVIAVETRAMEVTVPADPANLNSEVQVSMRIV